MPSLAELLGFGRSDDPWNALATAPRLSHSPIFDPFALPSAPQPSWLAGNATPPPPSPSEPSFQGILGPILADSDSRTGGGGILGPLFTARGDGSNSGGILQGLFPEPSSNARPAATSGGLLGPPLIRSSNIASIAPFKTQVPFLLSNGPNTAGTQKVFDRPSPAQALALGQIIPHSDPESGAQSAAPSTDRGFAISADELLAPRALRDGDPSFAAQQDELSLTTQTLNGASAAASAARNTGSAATSNGKMSDPAVANSYTQAQATIASDSELSAALRMAENAGDSTFRDRFASIISDLDLDPAGALDAIRKEVFGSKVRASTSGTAADAVAFAAIWRVVNRLHELRPDLGIVWSREAGFRPAVALAEEQQHVLHSIAVNPDLTFQEKLDRMADAGLFDVPLASVLSGIASFGYRSTPFGPADRPGGGGRSRIPRNLGSRIEAAAGREVTRQATASLQSAEDARNTPGRVTGSGRILRGPMWSELGEGWVPRQVADKLRDQTFASMTALRAEFWKTVASVPELAKQFNSTNRRLMAQGNAPYAPKSHHVGDLQTFRLHHDHLISEGGPVYDLDNIRIVSPLQHHQIHYGRPK